VHLKDKQDKEDITECVYKVPCTNFDKTYVGETERKLAIRLHEHKPKLSPIPNEVLPEVSAQPV